MKKIMLMIGIVALLLINGCKPQTQTYCPYKQRCHPDDLIEIGSETEKALFFCRDILKDCDSEVITYKQWCTDEHGRYDYVCGCLPEPKGFIIKNWTLYISNDEDTHPCNLNLTF